MIAEVTAPAFQKEKASAFFVGGRGRGVAEHIVDRALVLFSAGGFHGVSIGDLGKDLGLAKASVMHHFSSKEKLYDAVLARVGMSLNELLDTFATSLDPGPAGIASIARAYLDWVRSYPDGANLLARELLDNTDRAPKAERWHLRPFTDRIREHICRGQSLGLIRPCDSALVVEMILGFCQLHIAARPTRPHLLGVQGEGAYTATLDRDWPDIMAAAFATPGVPTSRRRKAARKRAST